MFGFGLVSRFDTSSLAGELAKIGDLVPADFALLHDFDLGDRGGVDGEGTFHADARGDFPHGEGGGDAGSAALHDNAFEDLVTLLFVLDDADIHFDGVTGGELRNIVAKLTGGDFIDEIVVHESFLLLAR